MATILASAAAAHDEKLWVWSDPERGRDVSRRREDGAAEYPSDGYYRFVSTRDARRQRVDGDRSGGGRVVPRVHRRAGGSSRGEGPRSASRGVSTERSRFRARASERERAKDAKRRRDRMDRDMERRYSGRGRVPEETVSGMTPSFGAVNGATPPNGDVLDTNVHASEAWAGPTYALAAHMLPRRARRRGVSNTGLHAYRATWEARLGFRTPEAGREGKVQARHGRQGGRGVGARTRAPCPSGETRRDGVPSRGGTGSRRARHGVRATSARARRVRFEAHRRRVPRRFTDELCSSIHEVATVKVLDVASRRTQL